MSHISSELIKNSLLSSIDSLLDRRDEFLYDPESSFTRTKKISFSQTVLFPMIAGSDNVATELLDYFGEDKLPLPSAMIQRRNQIKPEAFIELFDQFSKKIPVQNTYHGYQLIACDGTRLNLPYNPSDSDSFIQCIEGRKGINQIHMNALYDLLNDMFLDVELQNIKQMNEKAAFCRFLDQDRNSKTGEKRIYIADRGYATYNDFAHAIHNNKLFLIRVPEGFAKRICKGRVDWLQDACVDENVTVHIARRRNKEFYALENLHIIPRRSCYDYAAAGTNEFDRLNLRVLKFPVGDNGTPEYIVTNLPAYGFSSSTIKELYRLRWGEETAFRHLKYAGNMVHIHSIKRAFLIQEIYAKLTLYNFSSYLSSAVSEPFESTEMYLYAINHTQMQKIVIRFIKGIIENVETLISRFRVPIRLGRKFKRNLRRQSADTLLYR